MESNNHINAINVAEKLLKNKDDYIYYKTDHHWTSYGAYLAYLTYMDSLGLEAIDIDKLEEIKGEGLYNSISDVYDKLEEIKGDGLYSSLGDVCDKLEEIKGDGLYNGISDICDKLDSVESTIMIK